MPNPAYSGANRPLIPVSSRPPKMDTKNKITAINQISVGSLNQSIIHPRKVFKAAILSNSNGIILVHNHPSGDDIEIKC